MLALEVSLALIVCGGTASALVTHLSLTSAHKALPSGAAPSGVLPSGAGPSGAGPSGAGPSGAGASQAGASQTVASGAAQVQVPHACGFPDATNTGVPSGTALRSVPKQVSSGPGWHFDPKGGYVVVTARGTVLSGLYIPHLLVIDASDVTVENVQVVTGGNWGISLTHTTGVTIEDSTISGQNSTTGRVGSAIDDTYGGSTGIVIKNNNISEFKTAVQVSTGLIAGNYIHDPGYLHGDHTNGIYTAGTTEPLTIYGNTIFNDLGQTDDINLDASSSGQHVANKTVVDNLLAGGDYSIYGGDARGNPTSNIVIEDNEFGRLYYPEGGRYGPAAYVNLQQAGNVWSGNVWSGTSLRPNVLCGGLLSAAVPTAAG
jgi:Right handed beta helix region